MCYILRWIPEQGEDLYDVLVDGATVAHIEIPRHIPAQETVFESWPVEEYRRTRGTVTKPERRKLELALQLDIHACCKPRRQLLLDLVYFGTFVPAQIEADASCGLDAHRANCASL
jgi:hypothetical protein